MSPSNCPPADSISDFALGKLSAPAMNEVASHVETCFDCQATLVSAAHESDTVLSELRRLVPVPLPTIAAAHARKTGRLVDTQRRMALNCGGEGGARLSKRLEMPASADTLIRLIRRKPLPSASTPRVLGVDDWAFRRGKRYGTILCDLERRQVIDLLPERSSESFAAWLLAHPGVEIISRDRGDCYIRGATVGAPSAVQVADRWHLHANLRETIVRIADRHRPQLLVAARTIQTDSIAASDGSTNTLPHENLPKRTAT